MKGFRANNILETHRLLLRPWSRHDVAGYHRLWGDPKVVWWRAPCNGLKTQSNNSARSWPDATTRWPWLVVCSRPWNG